MPSRQPKKVQPKESSKHTKTKGKSTKINKKQLRNLALSKIRRSTVNGTESHLKGRGLRTKEFLKNKMDVEQFKCNICLEVLIRPFSLPCGHVFCYYCIDDLSKHKSVNNSCPCCRHPIDDIYPTECKTIKKILHNYIIDNITQEEKECYQVRKMRAFKEFKQRLEGYLNVAVGEKVDMKIGNSWEVGIVKEIVNVENRKQFSVIQRDTKDVFIFREGSTHLAQYHTFTRQPFLSFEDVIVGPRLINLQRLSNYFDSQLNNIQLEISRTFEDPRLNIASNIQDLWADIGSREDWVNPGEDESSRRNENINDTIHFFSFNQSEQEQERT